MAGAAVRRETARIAQETAAMSYDLLPELALNAVEAAPSSCDGSARDDARIAGPGRFDSSWELRRGLDVGEDWFGDACLHGWIERLLSAQRAAPGRTASPSASTAIA
jgi:hypothetical protein